MIVRIRVYMVVYPSHDASPVWLRSPALTCVHEPQDIQSRQTYLGISCNSSSHDRHQQNHHILSFVPLYPIYMLCRTYSHQRG